MANLPKKPSIKKITKGISSSFRKSKTALKKKIPSKKSKKSDASTTPTVEATPAPEVDSETKASEISVDYVEERVEEKTTPAADAEKSEEEAATEAAAEKTDDAAPTEEKADDASAKSDESRRKSPTIMRLFSAVLKEMPKAKTDSSVVEVDEKSQVVEVDAAAEQPEAEEAADKEAEDKETDEEKKDETEEAEKEEEGSTGFEAVHQGDKNVIGFYDETEEKETEEKEEPEKEEKEEEAEEPSVITNTLEMVGQYLTCSLPKCPGLCAGADQNNIDIEENPAEEDEEMKPSRMLRLSVRLPNKLRSVFKEGDLI